MRARDAAPDSRWHAGLAPVDVVSALEGKSRRRPGAQPGGQAAVTGAGTRACSYHASPGKIKSVTATPKTCK